MENPSSLAPNPILEPTELATCGTVLLWTERKDGVFEDRGTGFFYRNGSNRFVVTARHVLLDDYDNFRSPTVRFRLKTDSEDLSKSRDVHLPLWNHGEPQFRLADDPIDLAAIPVPDDLVAGTYIRDFSPEMTPPTSLVLPLGTDVLVIGYPKGLYDEANNLPLARRGSIASVYRAHFNKRPIFKLDAHLHVQMSGAPVLLNPTATLFGRSGRFEMRNGQVSFFLGVHFRGFDTIDLHEAYYPELVERLTSPTR